MPRENIVIQLTATKLALVTITREKSVYPIRGRLKMRGI